ncbi:MAG: aspartate-semialdehyde dehydrogenase [Peptococcaceae bacterium]|nr:aspartate-semialdehyde dehydrogenase [Peptococcaceae bacterium]
MPNIAIVGATGAVGAEFLKVFAERNFPVDELRLLATQRSRGSRIRWRDREIEVQETTEESFRGMDFVLFAGGSASTEFVPAAVTHGAIVIDNSSAFRMDPEVPLVIPEINPEDAMGHKGIIANPNCSTIIMAMALKPIEDAVGIDRVVVSTYQAVSGAGRAGVTELDVLIQAWARGEDVEKAYGESEKVFVHPIAFNIIPHIDRFCEGGYTNEELKMVRETQKIFHRPDMRIAATAVRVPVWRSHSESVTVETKVKMSAEEAREAMRAFPGLVVQDDPRNTPADTPSGNPADSPQKTIYPMPMYTADLDEVFVGRIREDVSVEKGLCFWVVGDQLRKGAATNAVQIAELFL